MTGPRAIALVAGLLVLLAGPARAELNQPAPPLEAKEWVGAPVDWAKERGKVVLILFVTPKQPDSEAALKDQVEILKIRGTKEGLDTILVSEASKAETELWTKSAVRGSSFRIAIEAGGSISRNFMVQVNPWAVLVDRDGRDVFEGHALRERVPLAKAIEAALDRAPTVPRGRTSERLKPAWAAMDKRDWGGAVKLLREIADDPMVTSEDNRDAKGMLWMIGSEGKKLIRRCLTHMNLNEWYEALSTLEESAAAFTGHEVSDEMKKLADQIRKDPKLKKEVAAGDDMRAAEDLAKQGKTADALVKMKAILTKHKGTKVADRAKKRIAELEAGKK